MDKIDRLGWAAGITFVSYGLRIGIRVSSPEIMDRIKGLLPPKAKPARGPRVERLYSLIVSGTTAGSHVRRIHVPSGDAVRPAHYRQDKTGQSARYRGEALDNVGIKTAKDDARADRAVYNVQSGIATLTGSVKIMRGRNQLRGCRAEINLNTGISKIFGCGRPGSGGEPVRGVIQPGKKK